MTLRVEVSFDPRSLVRANDGLDLAVAAARYGAGVEAAIRREFPDAEVLVRVDDSRLGTHVSVAGAPCEADAQSVERTVRDLAWVVREMVPFG